MAFNLEELKKTKETSGAFCDVAAKIQKIVGDEKFEDELQEFLMKEIEGGVEKTRIVLSLIRTNRGENMIQFHSISMCGNCGTGFHYTICEKLCEDNIKNLKQAVDIIKDKLSDLKLKNDFKPNPDMGEDLSFEYCVEHQTYDNTFTIYLDF